MIFTRIALLLSFIGFAFILFSSCDPVPRRTLSVEEKQADLLWVYSQFGQNYAPLQYKEERLGKSYDALKKQYLDEATKTQTNEEFYDLLFRFVSEFEDAHTSGTLTQSSLPGRSKIAYLGFSGVREKDYLVIKSLLPTIKDADFPVKVGDHVLKLDGVDLTEKAKELFTFRNLGRLESNLTYHMNKLFTRVSTMNGLPSTDVAVLTVRRGTEVFSVTLPWIVKDVVQFQDEQAREKERADRESKDKEKDKSRGRFTALSEDAQKLFSLSIVSFNGRIEFPMETLARIRRSARRVVTDGFQLVDAFAGWVAGAELTALEEKSPEQLLRDQRAVPEGAVFLSMAKTFPAYVSREKLDDATEALVGTIYVDTFSPDAGEKEVIDQWKQTLAALEQLGVKFLVLDLLNNGGGSLSLGMQMAQLLSPQALVQPTIRLRLSDSWMDQFEMDALDGISNTSRELSRRVLTDLRADRASGEWLSRAYPVDVLMPYRLQPNAKLKAPFKMAVLVNEMCASMCDIFSAVLQDNGLATIVGTTSMGAGGNVVSYNQAPNSHFDVRQTESLIYRKDGSAIENNGVVPDLAVSVVDYTTEKYLTVRATAVRALLKPSGT